MQFEKCVHKIGVLILRFGPQVWKVQNTKVFKNCTTCNTPQTEQNLPRQTLARQTKCLGIRLARAGDESNYLPRQCTQPPLQRYLPEYYIVLVLFKYWKFFLNIDSFCLEKSTKPMSSRLSLLFSRIVVVVVSSPSHEYLFVCPCLNH